MPNRPTSVVRMTLPHQPTTPLSAIDYDQNPRSSTPATKSSLATPPALHGARSRELKDLLAKLPPELLSMVLHSLLDEGPSEYKYHHPERRFLSRSSLVCREWCHIQRPKLFSRLRIETSAHFRFLLDLLRHRNNGWLPGVVKYLEIEFEVDSCLSLDRSLRLLAGKLPSLLRLSMYPKGYDDVSVSASLLKPFFAHHSSLRRLELTQINFLSFSALVHTLQDMADLEELELDTTSWGGLEDRPPTRMSLSSFPKLHFVKFSHEVSHFWMSAWLFAPLLARRCVGAPEDATSNNSDALLLSVLTRCCCEREAFQCDVELSYDKDKDAIAIECFPTGTSGWYLDVELWSSTSLSADGKWSTIRSIDCRDTDGTTLEEMDWEFLDETIARNATRLENISISSDRPIDWTPLLTRLPKLGDLNKVSVEAFESDSDQDDYLPPDELDFEWFHAMMSSPAFTPNFSAVDAPTCNALESPPRT